MKRKHKMNIGLTFFVVALFVVSTGMTAIGNVVSNDVEKNYVSVTSDKTENVGTITIGDNYITIDAKDKTVDLDGSDDLKIEVTVYFKLTGWCDHGRAYLGFWDCPAEDSDNYGGDYSEATLSFTIQNCKPGQTFEIQLTGKYEDCMNTDFSKRGKSTVTIKKPKPDLKASGEIKGTNLKPTSHSSVGTDVQIWNGGEPGSNVHWGYSEDRLYGDWDIFPGSGWLTVEDGKQSLEIWVTLPEGAKDYNDNLRIYNVDDPDNDYIDIPINLKVKKSKSTLQSYTLLERLFVQFPLLRVIQNLLAFQ